MKELKGEAAQEADKKRIEWLEKQLGISQDEKVICPKCGNRGMTKKKFTKETHAYQTYLECTKCKFKIS